MNGALGELHEQPLRGVVPGTCVRLSGHAARVGAPDQTPTQPSIKLVKNGDVIIAIDIVCTCGHPVRIHCLYE